MDIYPCVLQSRYELGSCDIFLENKKTILSMQNQCKEQTNNKAPLTFFHYTRPHLEYAK